MSDLSDARRDTHHGAIGPDRNTTTNRPTLGDPRADKLVEVHFAEAIDVIRQILKDRFPGDTFAYSEDYVGQTCALIAVQVWPIFGALFAEGVSMTAAGQLDTAAEDGSDGN